MKNILINETNIHGNIEAVYSVPPVTLQATYIEWIKNLNKYYGKAGMSDIDVARNTGIKRTTFIRYRKKFDVH